MHVCFVSPEYVLPGRIDGGLANYIKKTGAALLQRGCRVSVIVLSHRDANWDDDGITVYEVQRSRLDFLRKRAFGKLRRFHSVFCQLFNSREIARKAEEIHAKDKIDIIQSSSYQAPGFFLLNNKVIPLCCRVSSYTPLVRSAYGKQRTFPEYLSDWLEIQQVSRATRSFAPSYFTADNFLKIEACYLDVVRTLFDLENVEFNESLFNSFKLPSKYFLFFGTLSRIKGVDLLANVLPIIFSKYIDVSMVFIGRDDGLPSGKKVFEFLKEECASYKDRLFYVEALSKDHLYPFVTHAIATVLPSRVDNYPNVCIESLVLGTPVIGTKQSSLEEIIIDGKTGFLAENSDPVSIKKMMLRILEMDQDERSVMVDHIKNFVKNMQNQDLIQDLIEFYSKTIKDWNGKNFLKSK